MPGTKVASGGRGYEGRPCGLVYLGEVGLTHSCSFGLKSAEEMSRLGVDLESPGRLTYLQTWISGPEGCLRLSFISQ